jgi:hypothetical protein
MRPDSAHLTQPHAPEVVPHLVAPDTYLIPNLYQAGPDTFLPVNSMVMTATTRAACTGCSSSPRTRRWW